MKNIALFGQTLSLFIIIFCNNIFAQPPSIDWEKSYGGSQAEGIQHINKTRDNGFVFCGDTGSNDGDVSGNHGGGDSWIIKLDGTGNIVWQKCYGGSNIETAQQIKERADGGFFIAGSTNSNDGEVSGNHSPLGADYWVIRTDSIGTILWQKCFGGTDGDIAYDMDLTFDGGCIVVGCSWSNDGDVSGNHSTGSYPDIWVVKIDSLGDLEWQKCFGGTAVDEGHSIKQTSDSGYVIGGFTSSYDGDITFNHGTSDYWLLKLDASGNLSWQKCLGGYLDDKCYGVIQSSNGGYVLTGMSVSNDGDVTGNHGGSYDFWIVKTDPMGQIQWQNSYGGSGEENAYDIVQTNDSGYIMAGNTNSDDGDVSGLHNTNRDCWIVKTDILGFLQWQKCLGGAADDYGSAIAQSTDSGFVLGATTFSNDGDVSSNHGILDAWVVKLSPLSDITQELVQPLYNLNACYNAENHIIKINFFSSNARSALLSVWDVANRQLFKNEFKCSKGVNETTIKKMILQPGIYVVNALVGGSCYSKKIIVVSN